MNALGKAQVNLAGKRWEEEGNERVYMFLSSINKRCGNILVKEKYTQGK